MTVFEFRTTAENHSGVDAGVGRDERDRLVEFVFRGESLQSDWPSLSCAKIDPTLPFGSFADFSMLAALPVAFKETLSIEDLRQRFLDAGELLPIKIEGESASVVNITKVIDAIDRPRSRLHRFPSGRESTDYPVFDVTRLPRSGFFRIQEAWNRLYFVEPPEGGFRSLYNRFGLSGIRFTERETVEANQAEQAGGHQPPTRAEST